MRTVCTATPGSDEWLESRQVGVTATQISSILGTNPWRTSLQVWEEKKGLAAPVEQNQRMRIGTLLEPAVLELAADNHGPIDRPLVIPSILGHDTENLAIASLDGLDQGGHPVEAKVTGTRWDSPPAHYVDQVLWQCGVVGADFGTLAVLRGTDYDEHHIRFDADWWEWALAEAKTWWAAYVDMDQPPPASVGDDMVGMFVPDAEEAVEVDAEVWDTYLGARAIEKASIEVRKQLEVNLQELVGSATRITAGDAVVGSWRATKGRKSVDHAALAAAGLLDDFQKVGAPGRSWRVK